MKPTTTFIYEIASISLGLASFLFFGILAFAPFMLMSFGEGNTFTLTELMFFLTMLASLVIVSLWKREKAAYIMWIADMASAASLVAMIVAYLVFSGDLQEPWLTQGGWFLRYNGLVVGCFLAATVVKVVSGLSFLISKLDGMMPGGPGGSKIMHNPSQSATAMIVGFCFAFLAADMFLFYAANFFGTALFLLVATMVILGASTSTTRASSSPGGLELELVDFSSENTHGTPATGPARLASFKNMLARGGTRPFDFGVFFVPLLVISVIAAVGLVLYPFNLRFLVEFTFMTWYLKFEMDVNFVFAIGVLVLGMLILPYFVYLGIVREKLHARPPVQRITDKLKISTVSFFDGFKCVLTALVVPEFFYYYDYELFYPGVIGMFSLFAVAGACIYWMLSRFKGAKPAMSLVAFGVLIVNNIAIYNDSTANAFSFYSGNFDVTYTLPYLHGITNLATTGIAIGIILCDFIFNSGFNHAGKGGDSTNRGVLIAFIFFVIGLLVIPLGFVLDAPGGDVGSTTIASPESFFGGIYFWISLASLYVLESIAAIHAITEWILPGTARRPALVQPGSTKPSRPANTIAAVVSPALFQKKFHVATLAFIIFASVAGGVAIPLTFQQAYQKPVVVYSPGNYWIWMEDSGERVNKDTLIAVDPASFIDAVNVSLARNEYFAFQLVLRSFNSAFVGFSCSISDFVHETSPSSTIPSSACAVRYEERVLDDEYPDLLAPISLTRLEANINHVFWVSLKTPYDAEAGVYHGHVVFTLNSLVQERVNVTLNVWNFTIPNMRHLRTNIGPGAGDYPTIDNYVYHRINDYGNGIWADLGGDNNWTFHWDSFDPLIEYKLAHGMNGFVSHYIGDRDPPIENSVWMLQLTNYVKGLNDHLVYKNWTRYAYIYFIDEFQMNIPPAYDRSTYFARLAVLLQAVKTAAPNLRIMTTTPPSSELGNLTQYIDIYCPMAPDYDKARWDELLSEGKEFWIYSCVQPYAPWPNSHLYNRLYECRILIWQVWQYKIHGFLYWSSREYYHGRNGMAYNGYGDGWFLYTRDGLRDSMRWENYLDGQEDYEYVWLLNATINDLETRGILDGVQAAAKRIELDSIVNSITLDRWHYCDHPATLYNGREAIGSMLHAFSAFTNITAIGEADWNPLG
nr:DUF4091 domain-containing protein [Candidatus Sigynarchaeota archaeon]